MRLNFETLFGIEQGTNRPEEVDNTIDKRTKIDQIDYLYYV